MGFCPSELNKVPNSWRQGRQGDKIVLAGPGRSWQVLAGPSTSVSRAGNYPRGTVCGTDLSTAFKCVLQGEPVILVFIKELEGVVELLDL